MLTDGFITNHFECYTLAATTIDYIAPDTRSNSTMILRSTQSQVPSHMGAASSQRRPRKFRRRHDFTCFSAASLDNDARCRCESDRPARNPCSPTKSQPVEANETRSFPIAVVVDGPALAIPVSSANQHALVLRFDFLLPLARLQFLQNLSFLSCDRAGPSPKVGHTLKG